MLFLAVMLVLGGWSAASFQAPAPKQGRGLRIVDVQFEDEHGDVRHSLTMRAGGEIVLTFRVEGFERRNVESQGAVPEERVRLLYEAELRDPQDVLVLPGENGEVDVLLGPRDEQWRPKIRWSGAVPSYAPNGEYKIQLRVKDAQGDEETTLSVPVRVRGETLQPAASLEIQQIEYASSENGPWYSRRYFPAGNPIYVRYKIVGFRVSPEKEVWVEQDWAVLDSEGRVIVIHENVVQTKQQSFYPPRSLPTTFDLKLDDPKPGTYTLRIAVRDRVGEQAIATDSNFFLQP